MSCAAEQANDATAQQRNADQSAEAQSAHEGLGDSVQRHAEQLGEYIDLTQLRAEAEILRAEAAQAKAQVTLCSHNTRQTSG